MKLALKLAYRNLIGAGLRTWLNVIVLSFSFVVIIWLKGIMAGWDYQAKTDMSAWEIGQGQLWCKEYNPYDPFTFEQSHKPVPSQVKSIVQQGGAMEVLVIQATIYPQGRMQSVIIKGIDPNQKILALPSIKLDTLSGATPVIIGSTAAKNFNLGKGDYFTARWRNSNGMFDAAEMIVTDIFSCNVPSAEAGQIYIPLSALRHMMNLREEATIVTFGKMGGLGAFNNTSGWVLKTKQELTKSVDDVIKAKSAGQSIFYFILLLLAMLAIFDTQVLSIFRRQKEIGTYVALGYTRKEVVGLFTVEGAMHSVLAALLSMVYGLPFLAWQAKVGWTMPVDASDFGMAMAQTLYPVYSVALVVSTVLIIVIATTVVSYWPSRKIARMNPTDALRGKIQ
jgi:ABC-type lipoprotein release transport system permease subunit